MWRILSDLDFRCIPFLCHSLSIHLSVRKLLFSTNASQCRQKHYPYTSCVVSCPIYRNHTFTNSLSLSMSIYPCTFIPVFLENSTYGMFSYLWKWKPGKRISCTKNSRPVASFKQTSESSWIFTPSSFDIPVFQTQNLRHAFRTAFSPETQTFLSSLHSEDIELVNLSLEIWLRNDRMKNYFLCLVKSPTQYLCTI